MRFRDVVLNAVLNARDTGQTSYLRHGVAIAQVEQRPTVNEIIDWPTDINRTPVILTPLTSHISFAYMLRDRAPPFVALMITWKGLIASINKAP